MELAELRKLNDKLVSDIQAYHKEYSANLTSDRKEKLSAMKKEFIDRERDIEREEQRIAADKDEDFFKEAAAKYASRPTAPAYPLGSGEGASAAGPALPPELQRRSKDELVRLRMRATGEFMRGSEKSDSAAIGKVYSVFKKDYGFTRETVDALMAHRPVETHALMEDNDALGGAWVVPEFRDRVIMALPEISQVVAMVTREPTSSDELQFPFVAFPTGDNASIASSDVSAEWVTDDETEASILSASTQDEPGTGVTSIKVHMLRSKLIKITYRLQQDARADITGIVQRLLSQTFALAVESALVNGSGVNRPLGILNSLGNDQRVPSLSATELTYKGLCNTYFGVNSGYAASTKAGWLFNRAAMSDLMTVTDPAGHYIYLPHIAPNQLLGAPIKTSPYMPLVAAGNAAAVYGDWAQYVMADRAQMMIMVYREVFQPNIGIRALARLGGKVVIPDAFRKCVIASA